MSVVHDTDSCDMLEVTFSYTATPVINIVVALHVSSYRVQAQIDSKLRDKFACRNENLMSFSGHCTFHKSRMDSFESE
jgi:hypothetical protein